MRGFSPSPRPSPARGEGESGADKAVQTRRCRQGGADGEHHLQVNRPFHAIPGQLNGDCIPGHLNGDRMVSPLLPVLFMPANYHAPHSRWVPSPRRGGGTGRGGRALWRFAGARHAVVFPLTPTLSRQGRGGKRCREGGAEKAVQTRRCRGGASFAGEPAFPCDPGTTERVLHPGTTERESHGVASSARPAYACPLLSTPLAVGPLPPVRGRDRERGPCSVAFRGRSACGGFPPHPDPLPPGERGKAVQRRRCREGGAVQIRRCRGGASFASEPAFTCGPGTSERGLHGVALSPRPVYACQLSCTRLAVGPLPPARGRDRERGPCSVAFRGRSACGGFPPHPDPLPPGEREKAVQTRRCMRDRTLREGPGRRAAKMPHDGCGDAGPGSGARGRTTRPSSSGSQRTLAWMRK